MKRAKLSSILFTAFLLAVSPAAVFADTVAQVQLANGSTSQTQIGIPQGFSGIFSCNQNGANAMSVGSLGATGGVYVPVADASVELNTGTLVYKECVLREVVDAQRQAAVAGFDQQATQQIQTGRNGAALYVQNPLTEKLAADNQIVSDDLQNNGTVNTVNSAFRTPVTQAVARGWVMATQQGNNQLSCSYGDVPGILDGQTTNVLDALAAEQNPACNPFGATLIANDMVMNDVAAGNTILDQEWQAGGMFYPVTTGGLNPLTQQIETPSSLVNSSYTQVIQSPFNQLQNANDLGQMVGALFAGISTQVLSSNGGGLTGITQPIGSSPSYLSQAIQQTTQNLQGAISNAALTNLQAAITVEKKYNQIMSSIADTLTGSINQYRSAENQCWQQIIQSVCGSSYATSTNTCTVAASSAQQCTSDFSGGQTCTQTSGQGTKLKIATSTEFSDAAINAANIRSLASTTVNNINVSNQALALLNQLIQNVSGTSADSQSVAVAQLNSLVANGQLHTQNDITTAEGQEQSVTSYLGSLSTQSGAVWTTITGWGGTNPNDNTQTNIPWDGTISPGIGWCNFKNQTTLNMWIQKWSI